MINDEMNPRYLLSRAGLLAQPRIKGVPGDFGRAAAFSACQALGWSPLTTLSEEAPLLPGDPCVVSTNVAAVARRASGRLDGWSALTGEWQPCEDAVVTATSQPVARGNVAALLDGQVACAFGAECGRWARLEGVPTAATLDLTPNMALVASRGDAYVYASSGITKLPADGSPHSWVTCDLSSGGGDTRISAPGTNVVIAGRTGGFPSAYCAISGTWIPLPPSYPPLAEKDELVAYSHVGIVRTQKWVHAFNANTQNWYSVAVNGALQVRGAGVVALITTPRGALAFSAVEKALARPGLPAGWRELKTGSTPRPGLSA